MNTNDGKTIATGASSGEIFLWDVEKAVLLHTLSDHKHSITGLAFFSPDGALLASGSQGDGTINLWNVKTGSLLGVLNVPFVKNIVFFLDGIILISESSDGALRLWGVMSK